jgi:hypothetical protein
MSKEVQVDNKRRILHTFLVLLAIYRFDVVTEKILVFTVSLLVRASSPSIEFPDEPSWEVEVIHP